jgi:hypothetical protein
VREEADGSRAARVLELFADSEEARRGLTGFFAGLRDIGEVSYTGSLTDLATNPLITHAQWSGGSEPRLHVEPGAMFRVVDLPAALTALAPNFEGWRGRLVFAMTDPQTPHDWPRGAELRGGDGGIAVDALHAGDPRLSSPNRIEGDVRIWSQVLAGSMSLHDALSLNRLHAFRPDSGAAATFPDSGVEIFPRRDFFIPPADHF